MLAATIRLIIQETLTVLWLLIISTLNTRVLPIPNSNTVLRHNSTEQISIHHFIFRLVYRVDLWDSNRVEHITMVLVVKNSSQIVVVLRQFDWHPIARLTWGENWMSTYRSFQVIRRSGSTKFFIFVIWWNQIVVFLLWWFISLCLFRRFFILLSVNNLAQNWLRLRFRLNSLMNCWSITWGSFAKLS